MEWLVSILGGQDKALWEEVIRNIKSKNFTLIRPLGKWTRTGNIQQTALLEPERGILYMKEATGWRIYTYKTLYIIKRCDTKYIRHTQVENLIQWTRVALM